MSGMKDCVILLQSKANHSLECSIGPIDQWQFPFLSANSLQYCDSALCLTIDVVSYCVRDDVFKKI